MSILIDPIVFQLAPVNIMLDSRSPCPLDLCPDFSACLLYWLALLVGIRLNVRMIHPCELLVWLVCCFCLGNILSTYSSFSLNFITSPFTISVVFSRLLLCILLDRSYS